MKVLITYDRIGVAAVRHVRCANPHCLIRLRRQRTFYETLSPFNINRATGEPKTMDEIYTSLNAKAAAWDPAPAMCTRCSP